MSTTATRLLSGRFLRFVVASGVAAGVNFGSRILFSLAMPYAAAITCAFVCGLASAFVLNRLFVFEAPVRSTGEQMFWFVAVNLFGLVQTLAVSLLLARWIFPAFGFVEHAELAAHAFGIAVPVFTSYFLHKRLAFLSASSA